MKVKRFYKESANIDDVSQDKVQLNLSFKEWTKLINLVDSIEIYLPETKDGSNWIKKHARNIRIMFQNAQQEEPEWY